MLWLARVTFVTVLLSGAVSQAASAQRPDTTHFTAAVLRDDGVVVPIAEFSKGTWKAPWVKDGEKVIDLPPFPWFARGRTPSKIWYYYPRGADQPLTASDSVEVTSHCSNNWGLRTTFPGVPIKQDRPHSIVSFVLDIDRALARPPQVVAKSAEWNHLFELIAPKFDSLEVIRLKEEPDFAKALPQSEARRKAVLYLEANRIMAGQRTWYYISARREYPSGNKDCNYVTRYGGWIAEDGKAGSRELSSLLVLDTCDLKMMETVAGIQILTISGDTYVFLLNYGWEWEYYSINVFRPTTFEQLLAIGGGSC